MDDCCVGDLFFGFARYAKPHWPILKEDEARLNSFSKHVVSPEVLIVQKSDMEDHYSVLRV